MAARKPVRGWRKSKASGAWSLRIAKLTIWRNSLGELSIDSDVKGNAWELVDAERWALVRLKDAWQRLARKIAERESRL